MEYIEAQGNVVKLEVEESDSVIFYRVRFESIEDHFLLQSRGSVAFAKSKRHGRTKFYGGTLFPGLGPIQDIESYRDLDIIVNVYTPSAPEKEVS